MGRSAEEIEFERETRALRPDAADLRTALVLTQERIGKPWAMPWRIRETMRMKWEIEESPAWIAARLAERAREYGDVERVWLRTRRGAILSAWATVSQRTQRSGR
jgi:hypothetical protein